MIRVEFLKGLQWNWQIIETLFNIRDKPKGKIFRSKNVKLSSPTLQDKLCQFYLTKQ